MFFGKLSFRPGKSFLRSDAARHARGSGYRTHPDDDDDLGAPVAPPPRQSVKGKATFFFGARGSGRRGPAPKKDETPEQLRARLEKARHGDPDRASAMNNRVEVENMVIGFTRKLREMEGSKWVMLPENGHLQNWGLVMLIALSYTALVTPYEVGVLGDWKAGDKQFYLKPLYILNSLFNLIFAIDIVVCFFTGYVHHAAPGDCDDPMEGKVVREFQRIAEHYLKGGFSFDLVVTIPWDEIFEATQSGGSNDAMKFVPGQQKGATCPSFQATSRRSRGAATTRASRSSGCRATRCRT